MTKLIKVKIKIGELFEKLNLNNDKYEEVQEVSTKIYIKTPQNESGIFIVSHETASSLSSGIEKEPAFL